MGCKALDVLNAFRCNLTVDREKIPWPNSNQSSMPCDSKKNVMSFISIEK
jgi:hypothetical protein